MKRTLSIAIVLGGLLASFAWAAVAQDDGATPGQASNGHGAHADSPYADAFDPRAAIRALTPEEIAQIEGGDGAGYAKAAELNGVPGPGHVLDLQDELDLTVDQAMTVEDIFAEMRATVIPAGQAYLAAQRALEADFRAGELTASELPERVAEVAALEAALASGHLAAHVQTSDALTPVQIAEYNRLRGYA